ncbi:MAG: Rrf2 family transcriptional regulator [Eubacteriales bacterium]|nr:Rrf2 family transcriptional regulator [Eubacteriales bacterium]
MKITRETDYALRIMRCLAQHNHKSISNGINVSSISDMISAPRKFSLKILGKLRSGGFVKSFKGSGGGFALAKKPSEINLLDIIVAIDGPVAINETIIENSHKISLDSVIKII